MRTNRNKTIDIAKGLAIYLVVLGHLQLQDVNTTIILIAASHMPIFFFISGLFFEKSFQKYTTKEYILNKTKTLLVPYLVWSMVAFVVNAVLSVTQGGDAAAITSEAYSVFIQARSVWFLIVLYITCISAYIIRTISCGKKFLFLLLELVFWLCLLYIGRVEVLSLYKFVWLLPYYVLGCALSYNDWLFRKLFSVNKIRPIFKGLLAIIIMCAYIVVTIGMYRQDLFSEFYVKYDLVFQHIGYYVSDYLVGIVGIAGILLVSLVLSDCKSLAQMISLMGNYSLDIYVIHMFFVKIALIVIEHFGTNSMISSQAMLVIWSLMIAVVITGVVHFILRNNKLYRLSLGGR